MGIGDEIMVTGEVIRAQKREPRLACPRPVVVLDRHRRPRWHPIWDGNERIARVRSADTRIIINGPGCRPYIDYAAMKRWAAERGLRWGAKDKRIPWQWAASYQATPGEIVFGLEEARWAVDHAPARPFVVVEPGLKPGAPVNKDWGRARWQALVAERRDLCWVQLGPLGTRTLEGVMLIETGDFRLAAALLASAAAFVGTDGALHHAAAALGVRAVVIWGGYTHPRNLGYAAHVNLHGGGDPCGARLPCDHCRNAMAAITPEQAAAALDRVLS